MGTGPSLQCPNQCSLPQVLRLSHFKLISNAIQLVLAQLCCHTYWPRSSLVVGKWAEVASAWPPSGQPCLPLHHPPTHQHLSWATCNFENRKKGETKLIPMTENDICWIEIRFQVWNCITVETKATTEILLSTLGATNLRPGRLHFGPFAQSTRIKGKLLV